MADLKRSKQKPEDQCHAYSLAIRDYFISIESLRKSYDSKKLSEDEYIELKKGLADDVKEAWATLAGNGKMFFLKNGIIDFVVFHLRKNKQDLLSFFEVAEDKGIINFIQNHATEDEKVMFFSKAPPNKIVKYMTATVDEKAVDTKYLNEEQYKKWLSRHKPSNQSTVEVEVINTDEQIYYAVQVVTTLKSPICTEAEEETLIKHGSSEAISEYFNTIGDRRFLQFISKATSKGNDWMLKVFLDNNQCGYENYYKRVRYYLDATAARVNYLYGANSLRYEKGKKIYRGYLAGIENYRLNLKSALDDSNRSRVIRQAVNLIFDGIKSHYGADVFKFLDIPDDEKHKILLDYNIEHKLAVRLADLEATKHELLTQLDQIDVGIKVKHQELDDNLKNEPELVALNAEISMLRQERDKIDSLLSEARNLIKVLIASEKEIKGRGHQEEKEVIKKEKSNLRGIIKVRQAEKETLIKKLADLRAAYRQTKTALTDEYKTKHEESDDAYLAAREEILNRIDVNKAEIRKARRVQDKTAHVISYMDIADTLFKTIADNLIEDFTKEKLSFYVDPAWNNYDKLIEVETIAEDILYSITSVSKEQFVEGFDVILSVIIDNLDRGLGNLAYKPNNKKNRKPPYYLISKKTFEDQMLKLFDAGYKKGKLEKGYYISQNGVSQLSSLEDKDEEACSENKYNEHQTESWSRAVEKMFDDGIYTGFYIDKLGKFDPDSFTRYVEALAYAAYDEHFAALYRKEHGGEEPILKGLEFKQFIRNKVKQGFIRTYMAKNGKSPSIKEIQEKLDKYKYNFAAWWILRFRECFKSWTEEQKIKFISDASEFYFDPERFFNASTQKHLGEYRADLIERTVREVSLIQTGESGDEVNIIEQKAYSDDIEIALVELINTSEKEMGLSREKIRDLILQASDFEQQVVESFDEATRTLFEKIAEKFKYTVSDNIDKKRVTDKRVVARRRKLLYFLYMRDVTYTQKELAVIIGISKPEISTEDKEAIKDALKAVLQDEYLFKHTVGEE